MILLDTNVLSEFTRRAPSSAVQAWIASQRIENLFTTTITQAEILYGIALLPEGRRREELNRAAHAMFAEDFAGRILPFDSDAAGAYAEIVVARRLAGRPIGILDAQIAAIAHSCQAQLATRNVSDFAGCGIRLIDPWTGVPC